MRLIKKFPIFSWSRKGFALISTLSIIVLLAFIAVGLLSLSSLSLRQGANAEATEKAQINAKLGLLEAINELQASMGPDQRVSAPADLMVHTDSGVNQNTLFNNIGVNTVLQPHTIGAWYSWQHSNTDFATPDYAGKARVQDLTQTNQGFINWLTSGTTAQRTSLTTPTVAQVNAVPLIGENTVADATKHVNAELVPSTSGNYAWHVFDESMKANLKLNNILPSNKLEELYGSVNGGEQGLEQVADYSNLTTSLYQDSNNERIIYPNDLEILDAAFISADTNAFYDFTTCSRSVLADVAKGGLKTDLSLLFDLSQTDFDSTRFGADYVYSDDTVAATTDPTRFDYAMPLPNPDPKWSLLYDYSNQYRNVDSSGGTYSVNVSTTNGFDRGGGYDAVDNPVKVENTDFTGEHQIHPVVANAQFIYSIGTQRINDTLAFVIFYVDTVVTLWNPYNVEVDLVDMELEFYRFPMLIDFYKNGNKITSESVHTANMFRRDNLVSGSTNSWGDQDDLPYRAKLKSDNTVLAPGEYKVFGVIDSSEGLSHHHAADHFTHGIELREGWNPYAGGVSSRFMLVNNNYAGVGENGSSFIIANPGDVYSAEISAGKLQAGGGSSASGGIRSGALKETNEEEIAAFIKVFQGDVEDHLDSDFDGFRRTLDSSRAYIGSIALDLPDGSLGSYLPTLGPNSMSHLQFPSTILEVPHVGSTNDVLATKVPLCIASLRLKTENDSNDVTGSPNAPFWLHNGITNTHFSNGITGDLETEETGHQYELTWQPMTSWIGAPFVEINAQNQGFGATGVTSEFGVNQAVVRQIPLAPLASIAQLSHAPVNAYGNFPATSQVVGNSYAPLDLDRSLSRISNPIGSEFLDQSFMANNTLFDGYFFSTAGSETGIPLTDASYSDSSSTKLNNFFNESSLLNNPNYIVHRKPPEGSTSGTFDLTDVDHDTLPQFIMNEGAFNVNSTSVNAWAMFLASGSQASLPILDVLTASTSLTTASDSPNQSFSRFAPMLGEEVTSGLAVDDPLRWGGHKRLSPDQILILAHLVVEEVKQRGPFQSLAEFVNRRIEDTDLGNKGALQSAIDTASGDVSNLPSSVLHIPYDPVNESYGQTAPANEKEVKLDDASAYTANTSDGSPSHLTQADILTRLGSSMTVRGDTFVIRSYGESPGAVGKAWCEAVVQRQTEYVDDTDLPATDPSATTAINQQLGRKFKIVSFRWLDSSEI